eukprot:12902577-Ditylum_brightwellii.AAC.1
MGEFAKSKYKAAWKEYVFENYEKIDRTGALSAPILHKDLHLDTKILRSQPAFKVKLQEEEHMYELYVLNNTNDSKQVKGVDFNSAYTPISFYENSRYILTLAAAE